MSQPNNLPKVDTQKFIQLIIYYSVQIINNIIYVITTSEYNCRETPNLGCIPSIRLYCNFGYLLLIIWNPKLAELLNWKDTSTIILFIMKLWDMLNIKSYGKVCTLYKYINRQNNHGGVPLIWTF